MELTFSDNKLFTTIFDNIKQYSDNIKMKLSSHGIHLQSIDDANVSIIDIHLNKTYFTDFNIIEELIYDFSITDICKILKICSKSRQIQFIFDNTILKIIASSSEQDIKKIFEINSIITQDTFLKLENLSSANFQQFNLDSKNLLSIFTELSQFSEDICIELNSNKLKFYTTNDTINTKYIINQDNIDNTFISKYSLNYLSKYKFISLFDNTTFKINTNNPLLILNKNEFIESTFILSPKIMDI